MSALGWLMMLGSLTFVWTLAGWCYWRIFSAHSRRAET